MSLDAHERGLLEAMQLVALGEVIEQARIALTKALARAQKRRVAIEGDIARANDVESLRLHGSMLLAMMRSVARGAREFVYENENGASIVVALDPAKGAKENADLFFTRARKLETGARIAQERLVITDNEIVRLRDLLSRLDHIESQEELDALTVEARKLKVALAVAEPATPTGKKKKIVGRIPYRRFEVAGERIVLVGKGAADNDELTLHHAKPQDLWMHARDVAGAHVVVPLQKGESCPSELLVDAAILAAHFSDARGQDRVDVQYTHKRFVRKPKGSPKGAVEVTREKVIVVRIEEARLKRLLANETLT